MNKSRIDWCDMTWNPVTGCLHGCEYCYARGIVRRFAGCYDPASDQNIKQDETGIVSVENTGRVFYKSKNGKIIPAPYPFGFAPTFHRYRLDEPQRKKKPQNIFVVSMGDLFGAWVPDEWIEAVFDACKAAPQHRYLFLTKYPVRLPLSSFFFNNMFDKLPDNCWFGKTVTDQKSLENGYKHFTNIHGNTFLSIEPLHESINLLRIDVGDVIYKVPQGMAYYMFGGQKIQNPKWVIIGAETGNRKGRISPERKWIEDIVNDCRIAAIPVFMKSNLADVWGEPLIQEFPW